MALPTEFLRVLDEVIPAPERARALASFGLRKPTFFRANTLVASPAEIAGELAPLSPAPVPWLEIAFGVPHEARRALTDSEPFARGAIYVQSLSSMLAPLALDPQPGEEILDLAAAPGGKTTMIAALMNDDGRVAAVEPVRERFFRLKANVERARARIVKLYPHDGRTIGRRVPGRFDRVLLDAPCSSEARFSTLDPESFAHWSPRKVRECARKQKALLQSAFDALASGGLLVYCTCSLSPEENEDAVQVLLAREPSARVEPWLAPIPDAIEGRLEGSVRVLPTETMDAFFICRIRKMDSG